MQCRKIKDGGGSNARFTVCIHCTAESCNLINQPPLAKFFFRQHKIIKVRQGAYTCSSESQKTFLERLPYHRHRVFFGRCGAGRTSILVQTNRKLFLPLAVIQEEEEKRYAEQKESTQDQKTQK